MGVLLTGSLGWVLLLFALLVWCGWCVNSVVIILLF